MCREKSQRGSLKKLQAHRRQRSTHCENILYQGPKGNKGRRMLEERWTVLAANEKMTQIDTISINTLWNIALVLLLCKTLVWETTQLNFDDFWLINFNTFLTWASLPSIFDHAGRFEVQQYLDGRPPGKTRLLLEEVLVRPAGGAHPVVCVGPNAPV